MVHLYLVFLMAGDPDGDFLLEQQQLAERISDFSQSSFQTNPSAREQTGAAVKLALQSTPYAKITATFRDA